MKYVVLIEDRGGFIEGDILELSKNQEDLPKNTYRVTQGIHKDLWIQKQSVVVITKEDNPEYFL